MGTILQTPFLCAIWFSLPAYNMSPLRSLVLERSAGPQCHLCGVKIPGLMPPYPLPRYLARSTHKLLRGFRARLLPLGLGYWLCACAWSRCWSSDPLAKAGMGLEWAESGGQSSSLCLSLHSEEDGVAHCTSFPFPSQSSQPYGLHWHLTPRILKNSPLGAKVFNLGDFLGTSVLDRYRLSTFASPWPRGLAFPLALGNGVAAHPSRAPSLLLAILTS